MVWAPVYHLLDTPVLSPLINTQTLASVSLAMKANTLAYTNIEITCYYILTKVFSVTLLLCYINLYMPPHHLWQTIKISLFNSMWAVTDCTNQI